MKRLSRNLLYHIYILYNIIYRGYPKTWVSILNAVILDDLGTLILDHFRKLSHMILNILVTLDTTMIDDTGPLRDPNH